MALRYIYMWLCQFKLHIDKSFTDFYVSYKTLIHFKHFCQHILYIPNPLISPDNKGFSSYFRLMFDTNITHAQIQ